MGNTIKIKGLLEIDPERGVIYFHEDATGFTKLRICRLPTPIPDPKGFDGEALDITSGFGVSWGHPVPAEVEAKPPITRKCGARSVALREGHHLVCVYLQGHQGFHSWMPLLSQPPGDLATRDPWWKQYQVDLPDGERGGWKLDHFTIEHQDVRTLRHAMDGRAIPNGTYTRLCRDHVCVMSDTLAEIGDHLGILQRLDEAPAGSSVLIHGLGLGMTLRCALRNPNIERIDVVEIDSDVVGLVGPYYSDARLTIHLDDALARRWPRGASWTYIWHDIWDTICEDHLPEMARLHRRFARRCTWQGSWGRRQAMADRARNRGRW